MPKKYKIEKEIRKMANLNDLVKNGMAEVEATAKKELVEKELKVKINGVTSRRNIKKVSDENGIPMNDVYVRINFSIEGKDDNVTYTASQRLSSLGNLYLDLEKEALKAEKDKKVYNVLLTAYQDGKDNPFISFLPEVSEDEFMAALRPATNKTKGTPSDLFSN